MLRNRSFLLTLAYCIYAVSTLTSMAGMSIGTGILVLAMLAYYRGPTGLLARLREANQHSANRRYLWLALSLSAVCIGSLIVGKLWPLSYGGKFSEIHLLKDSAKLWYLFWPLPLMAGLSDLSEQGRKRVLQSWLIMAGALGLLAIYQYYTGWPRLQSVPSLDFPVRYHATLLLGHHLSVANILIFPFFAALEFTRVRAWGWPRWVWASITILIGITLMLTFSRILWVALPVGLMIWAFLSVPRRWAIGLFVMMVIGAGLATQHPKVQARYTHPNFKIGLGDRMDLWRANFEFLSERPVLGVGWRHNQELSGYFLLQEKPADKVFSGHAHNNLIDMLGGTGVLGALVWIVWCIWVLAMAGREGRAPVDLQSPSAPNFARGLFCAWIVFQVNGLTQVNFWEAKVTHQMMWMVAWTLFWLSRRQSGSSARSG